MSEQENRPQNGGTQKKDDTGHPGGRSRHRRGRGGKKHRPFAASTDTAGGNTASVASTEQSVKPVTPAQQNTTNSTNNGGHGSGGRHRNRHRRGRRGEHPQGQEQAPQTSTASQSVAASAPIVPEAEPFVAPPARSATYNTPLRTDAVFGEEHTVDAETLALVENAPIIGGKPILPEDAVIVVGIRFREHGKIYYFDPNGLDLSRDIHVIVDTTNGDAYAFVATIPHAIDKKELTAPLRPVLRIATDAERETHKQNRRLEVDAYNACVEKIARHGLAMKLIDVECPFDRSKLLFFFTTPEERVDFRELVKDLAGTFHLRIEMRQIGIRDEARKLGGLGICGRPFCCSSFLSNFAQVTIKMAKEQNLALNAAKISGACGRLMCCLRYEHEVYEAEMRLTPRVDSIVATPDGNALVVESSPLAGLVKVRFLDKPDAPPKQFVREDVRVIGSKKKGITEVAPDAPADTATDTTK